MNFLKDNESQISHKLQIPTKTMNFLKNNEISNTSNSYKTINSLKNEFSQSQ